MSLDLCKVLCYNIVVVKVFAKLYILGGFDMRKKDSRRGYNFKMGKVYILINYFNSENPEYLAPFYRH